MTRELVQRTDDVWVMFRDPAAGVPPHWFTSEEEARKCMEVNQVGNFLDTYYLCKLEAACGPKAHLVPRNAWEWERKS